MSFYLKKRYKENILLFIIIVCTVLLKLKAAFLTAEAFNKLIEGNTETFLYQVSLCALLYFFYVILFSFQVWYGVAVRQKMLADIRENIIHHYASYSLNSHQNYSDGRMIAWLTTDITRIDQEGLRNFYSIVAAVIDVILSIVTLLYINWILTGIIILLAIANLLLPKLIDNKMSLAFQNLTHQQENFTNNITNMLGGFIYLFSLNKQKFLISKSHKEIKSICSTEINTYKVVGVATFLAALGNVLGQIGSLIIAGIFVSRKLLTFGDILSVSTISVNIFNGISNLASSVIDLKGVVPIFEKQKEFFTLIQEDSLEQDQKKKDIKFQSALSLENVNLSFDNHTILSDSTYEFEKGKKYCIVGPSGSGKSTLFKVLNGSLPYDSGLVKLDNHLLTDINSSSLRDIITYVNQSSYIFNGTIRENILLNGSFSDEKINEVINLVELSDEIQKFPKGLDTVIGDSGVKLSGGQQQRVVLARAIMNGSQFLLLDESTSNLNVSLAQSIEKKLLSDDVYSIIFITHHLSDEVRKYFDDIVELKQGKLVSVK